VEAGKREGYTRRREYRHVQQNAAKLSQVVHPGLGLTDVYSAVIPDLPFKPGLHVNYSETTLHMRDGLPKLKDFPKAFSGSGIELPE
jgi:hypothetical protein